MPVLLLLLLSFSAPLSAQYRGEAQYRSESVELRRLYFDRHQSRIALQAQEQYLLDFEQERFHVLDLEKGRGHSRRLIWLKEKGPTGREKELLGFSCQAYEFWDAQDSLLLLWICPDLPPSLTPGPAQTRGGILQIYYSDGRCWTLQSLKPNAQFFPASPFVLPAQLHWHWEAEEDIPALKHIDYRAQPHYRRK